MITLLFPGVLFLFAGCARLPTYVEAQATARAGGCWPDYLPTPPLVTMTPAGTVVPGTPQPTATPLTICPPRPGRTAVAWPTPVPPPPAFPTQAGHPWQTGGGQETTLLLPSAVLALDLAVHPTAGWPAVAATVWAGTDDPDRVMVSVYNPESARWSIARQVDLGPAQIGHYSRTVRLAVSGSGRVTVIWGMSDPDFTDNDPPSGIWASDSADDGETWSAPTRIAAGCRRVNDVVADGDGRLAVLLVCDEARGNYLAMMLRSADGAWQPLERLPVATNYFSESSLVLVGTGSAATVVGLTFVMEGGVATGYLLRRPLSGDTPAAITRVSVSAPADWQLGARMWNLRGLAFTRPSGSGVIFTFTDAEGNGGAYALTSLDGGLSWGGLERIAAPFTPGFIFSAAPAYDPAADRLVAVWSCCAGEVLRAAPATHYGSWSAPGSGRWQTLGGTAPLPLVLGSRVAGETTSAQAANSRHTWVAWVEGLKQVVVRSLDLNQLIPVDAYPTAAPFIAPTVTP